MPEIITLLSCLRETQDKLVIKQLSRVILAMLMMTGRVTMLGLSRWGEAGCSYRTIQRLFASSIDWSKLMWQFFWNELYCPGQTYVLIGDKTVVSKAGKVTYGLDRFFSSTQSRPIKGLCFQVLALGSVEGNWSVPVDVMQVVRSEEEKAATAKRKAKQKQAKLVPTQAETRKPAGRKKGSKNKDKVNVPLSPELTRLQAAVLRVMGFAAKCMNVRHLVLDGEYGHNAVAQMAKHCLLDIISKMRHDAALFLPYTGAYAGRGQHRKYGDKLNFDQLPESALKATCCQDGLETRTYQLQAWHKEFPTLLNVVILVKTNLDTHQRAHVILFSTDLALAANKITQLYALRFQIEFNFRDAKQFWGLEDFMNVDPIPVLNAASLSLFMTAISARLLRDFRQHSPAAGVLDLKAVFRGQRYANEALKFLPQFPEPFLLSQILAAVTNLGRIHPQFEPAMPA